MPVDETQIRDDLEAVADALPAYELGGLIGRGGFGLVYAGTHRRLGREVAIKVLAPEHGPPTAEARARFGAEARVLASLDHPHVVRVHDYVDDAVCALVMERLSGGTLASRSGARQGPEAPVRACAFAIAALLGLEHAHARGVVHRDVKPANLVFGPSELLKVADFGVAGFVGSPEGSAPAAGPVLGTHGYLAPERRTGRDDPSGRAADVWSLAAVLHELLTGVLPGQAGDDPNPALPPALAGPLRRALADDPAERFASAADFAAALEQAVTALGEPAALFHSGVPIYRVSDARLAPPATEPMAPALARLRRGTVRRRRLAGAALAGVCALAAAAAVLLTRGDDGPQVLPSAPAGWPKAFAVGWADGEGPTGVVNNGGVVAVAAPGQAPIGESKDADYFSPDSYVRMSTATGAVPYLRYYRLRWLGRRSESAHASVTEIRRALVDPAIMRRYWTEVARYLRSIGRSGAPVAIAVEPTFWSLLEQQLGFAAENPQSVPALVGGSGLPELSSLDDDLLGFVHAWNVLRARYAPNALLGYEFADYGVNLRLGADPPPPATVLAAARRSAEWFLLLSPDVFDFAGYDVSSRSQEGGGARAPAWTDAHKRTLLPFIREWVRVSNRPVVLENIPVGTPIARSPADGGYHWNESWASWLVGNERFSGATALRDAGAIGALFSFGIRADEVCPCRIPGRPVSAIAPDDDRDFLRDRLARLDAGGGLTLRR